MYTPSVYVIIAETRKICVCSEAYIVSVASSRRAAWNALYKELELNGVLDNPYSKIKFIPHQSMPYFIGISYTEYFPHPVHVRYTIHKEPIIRDGYYYRQ